MIAPTFVLDLSGARFVELPEPTAAQVAAGSYGNSVQQKLNPGDYLVIVDAAVGLHEGGGEEMRTGTGSKLEVPVIPTVPLPVRISQHAVTLAAKTAAAVVWFVPIVPLGTKKC